MDRHTWMYEISRVVPEYINCVEQFITCEEKHVKGDMITCSCRDCYKLK